VVSYVIPLVYFFFGFFFELLEELGSAGALGGPLCECVYVPAVLVASFFCEFVGLEPEDSLNNKVVT
jgi:hypothetical protein